MHKYQTIPVDWPIFSLTLTYIFKVTKFEMLLSEKRWDLAKMLNYDFIDVNIRHQMLQANSLAMTYIFQDETFQTLLSRQLWEQA